MEREKMVEEMVKTIINVHLECVLNRKNTKCKACDICKYKDGNWCLLEKKIAEAIYDLIIPEGAVVLTDEEIAKMMNLFRKETAREILQEVKSFLDTQTKTVDSLSSSKSRYAIPESCNECYKGSQENRIAEIKRIAEKYGVEVEE